MGIFDYNGKLYKFLVVFWNIVLVGVLWIVCSIPVFTIGPASCAAYYAMVKSVRNGEDRVFKDFFKSFKDNFKQGVIMGLVYLAVSALFTFATVFYYRQGSAGLGMRWFFYILILLLLCTVTYAFAWLSRFVMSTKHALFYPVMITLLHFKESLGLIVFWAAAIVGLYWAYNTFLFPILIVLIPGFKCLLDSFMIENVMKKYEPIAQANEAKVADEDKITDDTKLENDDKLANEPKFENDDKLTNEAKPADETKLTNEDN